MSLQSIVPNYTKFTVIGDVFEHGFKSLSTYSQLVLLAN